MKVMKVMKVIKEIKDWFVAIWNIKKAQKNNVSDLATITRDTGVILRELDERITKNSISSSEKIKTNLELIVSNDKSIVDIKNENNIKFSSISDRFIFIINIFGKKICDLNNVPKKNISVGAYNHEFVERVYKEASIVGEYNFELEYTDVYKNFANGSKYTIESKFVF